jgi:hypothetical protein
MKTEDILTPEIITLHRKLLWWITPSSENAEELLRKVMEKGTIEHIQIALEHYGKDAFRSALRAARFGEFTPPSWHFWHLWLGFSNTPPLPEHPAFAETTNHVA